VAQSNLFPDTDVCMLRNGSSVRLHIPFVCHFISRWVEWLECL